MAEISVQRLADGGVRVGVDIPEPWPDVTAAVLDVAGAVLVWPNVADLGLPVAYIHDVSQAQQWLWALYGAGVPAAVNVSVSNNSAEVRVQVEVTELADTAARLAFGHWAQRWWPASVLDEIPALAPDLLGLELAALTYQCQQLFAGSADDQPDDCVAELLADHQGGLAPLVQWWRELPAESELAQTVEAVVNTIEAAADAVGVDLPAGDAAGSTLVRTDYALAAGDRAGAGHRVFASGIGVNDWRRYPPGLVDAAESAVSWTASAIGARRELAVSAISGTMARGTLAAEIRIGSGAAQRIPLAVAGDEWTGRAELAAEGRDLEVAVLLPGFDPSVTTDGRADRDAVRALARQRLAGTASPSPFLAEIVARESDF